MNDSPPLASAIESHRSSTQRQECTKRMAGDWIKMRKGLFTHPKVVRISSALKADRLRTVGGLLSVWCLFDEHSEDGKLDGYSFETLDDLIGWPGFSVAMASVDWLAVDGESLVLPDFDTHNGQSAKRRAQDADRKNDVRKMSASNADKKRTREEKRREEEKDNSPLPIEAIRKAYNDALPMLPHCKKISGERERHLRARWNDPDRQSLEYWVEFFEYVASSDFLTGRSKSWGTWPGPDFDWFVNETNHVKVTEGKYENKEAA